MSPKVLLVGAPGAGKTTVGKELAAHLGVGFRDTDDDIVELAGKSIADIFIEDGEEAFRALETQALQRAIVGFDGVLSLGGGIVMRAENRELLADQPVVWLEVTLADAVQRVGMGTSRPLLLGNVRGRMLELLTERTPVYESVARMRVSTTGRTVQQVVDAILAGLGESND
jgi:shikimate kinase